MARTKMVDRCLVALAVFGIVLLAIPFVTNAGAKKAPQGAEALYLVASGLTRASIQDRRKAAAELAKRDDAHDFVVLLIMESRVPPPAEDEGRMRDWMKSRPFEFAVVYAAIQSLPKECPVSVQLALTSLLDTDEYAIWPERSGLIFQRLSSNSSHKPMRELARERLTFVREEDHEYDVQRWRTAILSATR